MLYISTSHWKLVCNKSSNCLHRVCSNSAYCMDLFCVVVGFIFLHQDSWLTDNYFPVTVQLPFEVFLHNSFQHKIERNLHFMMTSISKGKLMKALALTYKLKHYV
jgi:hypothetical protein